MAKQAPQITRAWYQKSPKLTALLSILAAVTTLLYWQIFDNPIFFDTAQNFSDEMFRDFFARFGLFFQRQIAHVTFSLLYKVFGMNWYPQHVLNLLLHLTTVGTLFWFLKLIFENVAAKKNSESDWALNPTWCALVGAVIFAVHPMAAYAVGYLIQRTIVMATLFSLVTLICYFRAITATDKKIAVKFFVFAIICYYLALFSKEHSIAVPAVCFLLTLFVRTRPREFLKRHAWVFGFFILLVIAAYYANRGVIGKLHEPHGQKMLGVIQGQTQGVVHPMLLSYISQATYFFRYIYLWLVPYLPWINIDVQLPIALSLTSPQFIFGSLAFVSYIVANLYVLIRGEGIKRLISLGLLFPAVLFATEFAVVRLSEVFVIYRSYLWMSGFYLIIPAFFVYGKNATRWVVPKLSILAVYVVVLGFVLHDRLNTFDSDLNVWQDVVNKIPARDNDALFKSYRAYNNLGFAQTAKGDIEEAIKNYYKAIQIFPDYVKARSNLGAVLTNRSRFHEAMDHFEHAIKIDPKYVDAIVGLGVCMAEQGLTEESIGIYARALNVVPGHPDALYNMGNSYLNLNQPDKAAEKYKESIKVKPSFADAHHNLGIAYVKMGQNVPAMEQFQESLKYNPNHPLSAKALQMLGGTLPPPPVQPKGIFEELFK